MQNTNQSAPPDYNSLQSPYNPHYNPNIGNVGHNGYQPYGNNIPPQEYQQPGYPQQPSYPQQVFPQQPGLPLGFPGFGQTGYPGQSGYPQQPGFPQQPGLPPQQPGFPMPVIPKFPIPDYNTSNSGNINGIDEERHVLEDNFTNSFSDKKIRQLFIRKVYMILTSQLLVTTGFIALFVFCIPVKKWVQRNQWFYWLSYGIFIITYMMLACPCCSSIRRKWPGNFICLSIFTLAMSYMTGTISSFYSTDIVLIAVGITAAVCFAISLFAFQTKIDFTLCSGVLFVFSIVFMVFGFICLIVYMVSGPNLILQIVYGALGALLFSLFLIFDTQMVVGGENRKHQLSPEEYIYGALQLYVDIVQLFLMILSLVGAAKRD